MAISKSGIFSSMIFFLGCSRSASKMYQYNINKYTDANISEELKLIYILPFYKSLVYFYLKYKYLHRSKEKFVSDLYRKLRGTFWEDRFISREDMMDVLRESDMELKSIVYNTLKKDAKNNDKIRFGAKFPLYVGYTPYLVRMFPDSRYVFLVRNPHDIYRSQINKLDVNNPLKRFLMIIHVSLMFRFTCHYITRYSGRDNFLHVKYEDMVAEKRKVMTELCRFLELNFHDEMVDPPIIESSVGRGDSGEESEEKVIEPSNMERWLIDMINRRHLRRYNEM